MSKPMNVIAAWNGKPEQCLSTILLAKRKEKRMLFATSSFGEGVFLTIFLVGMAIWAFRRLFRIFDKDGKVHGTAQNWLVVWLESRLKK